LFHADQDTTVGVTTCAETAFITEKDRAPGYGRTDFPLTISIYTKCPVTNSTEQYESIFLAQSTDPDCASLSFSLYPELMGTTDFWVTIEGTGNATGVFQLQGTEQENA